MPIFTTTQNNHALLSDSFSFFFPGWWNKIKTIFNQVNCFPVVNYRVEWKAEINIVMGSAEFLKNTKNIFFCLIWNCDLTAYKRIKKISIKMGVFTNIYKNSYMYLIHLKFILKSICVRSFWNMISKENMKKKKELIV